MMHYNLSGPWENSLVPEGQEVLGVKEDLPEEPDGPGSYYQEIPCDLNQVSDHN